MVYHYKPLLSSSLHTTYTPHAGEPLTFFVTVSQELTIGELDRLHLAGCGIIIERSDDGGSYQATIKFPVGTIQMEAEGEQRTRNHRVYYSEERTTYLSGPHRWTFLEQIDFDYLQDVISIETSLSITR
jgi:hypothetical protein